MESSPNAQEKETNWFEEYLKNSDIQSHKPGDLLDGVILRIADDGILVDVGAKRDALVPTKDLGKIDPNILENYSRGDQVHVIVLTRGGGDKDMLVSLNKGIEHESWINAEKYLHEGKTLELNVISYNRGGLIVQFETLRGFLPFSRIPELRKIRHNQLAEQTKKSMVGSMIEAKVIEVIRERNRLIFSATAAQDEKRKQRFLELKKDQIVPGKVVNIVDFGIFVDLDGIDGLVHLSQLDWKKVNHPSELYNIGDKIEVKVIEVDNERGRISLSRKAMLPSPWDIPDDLPKPGDCIEGVVSKIVNFGAFIELSVGIEGLVHISQLGYSQTENPKEVVKPGEIVLVRVMEIIPERRRISLSMRQVPREQQIAWTIGSLEEILPPTEKSNTGSDADNSSNSGSDSSPAQFAVALDEDTPEVSSVEEHTEATHTSKVTNGPELETPVTDEPHSQNPPKTNP